MGYNTITLYGEQICDYFYIQKNEVESENFKLVDSEPQGWDENTLMLARFNNDLIAGDSAITKRIDGYEIRRRKGANSYNEYVTTIKGSESNEVKNFIIDYGMPNNSYYQYYIYPTTDVSGGGIMLSPYVTGDIKPNWHYWSLMVVDETKEENVYYLSKLFKFEFNLDESDLNNNASVTVTQNFTRYPTVQYGASNYWSGTLSALCGFISCNDVEYIQSPNIVNELKSLTSDTQKMFLKNIDGDIWEVKITAPINISTDSSVLERVKTAQISWAEVADVENVSIINNPNMPTVSWVLTESGEASPYVEYIWDSQHNWNNDYRWTGKGYISENELSNMSRDLFSKDGES